MDNLKMHTPDLADENYKKLAALFPNAVTETVDENGEVVRAIDADVLRQEISATVVEGSQERYQFTWPDKKKSVVLANQPISKTLRLDREKSVGRDGTPGSIDTENIYIEGDNLDALKLLQETYLGKVKMIYIDPPYNTGSDAFVYDDDSSISGEEFSERSGQYDEDGNMLFDMRTNNESNGRFHTDWLNMIYPRLRLAKDLLCEDGFIAISIGEEENDSLKKICDEIFGAINFRNIIEARRYDKNLNLQFASDGLSTMNVGLEYIYVYSRNPHSKMTAVYKPSTDERASLGYWKGFWNNADRPTMRYNVLGVTPVDGQWKWKKEIAYEAVSNYKEYEEKFASKMTLEEYWNHTGRNKRFIRRKAGGSGKNLGVEHWVAPADGILRNSNWSDMLISKPVGVGLSFDSPKNPDVIEELIKLFGVNSDDVILDFFSGSATTAHAVMQLNAKDGGHRKFIMVQLPEVCDEKSEAYKAGYKNICEIGEERIRRAGKKIKEESPLTTSDLDVGFRVFRVDSSNMKDVYYTPAKYEQEQMEMFADNIKEDRTPEDLLYQVMLDLGIMLSSDIEETEIAGKRVFSVAGGYLIACFDSEVTDETVTEIAKQHPFYAVFRDSGMANDSVMTNFEQIFETYSPRTQRKVL
ncbi:MAG: site-specific DNA-methyltransferase [Oscillospiraceae bacterium]|nr:site-specific DNA-methyltransferase [Oscillospiraceae bacterium]